MIRKKGRWAATALAVAAVVVTAGGCAATDAGADANGEGQGSEDVTVRIGTMMEAGLAGDWDVAFVGQLPAITAGETWGLQTIGYFGDESPSHGIYVSSDSGITADNAGDRLAGETVLYTQGSANQLFLEACLDSWGLSLGDVQAVNLAPPDLVAAIQSGNGVAASTYPPFAFTLEGAGYENICDTAELEVSAYPTMVVTKEFLDANPETVAALTSAVFKANTVLRDDPEKAVELAQQFFAENGITQTDEDILKTLEVYDWVDVEGGLEIFTSGDAERSVKAFEEMLVANGLLPAVGEMAFLNDGPLTQAVELQE
jgi:ABC-type nitrate/sulfonate/bicarbonate transport system substrate-binding protein